ncbi:MAG: DUF5947 family protein [Thermomicrobiales bacterium]
MSDAGLPRLPASPSGEGGSPLGMIRRYIRQREPFERCELCNAAIPPDPDHRHLLDTGNRQVVCVCAACAVSMGGGQDSARRFRLIPQRVDTLADFQMSDALWDGVLIPVGMAFFFFSTAAKKMVAYYPSPAGATESLLSPDSWEAIVHANPALAKMEPDVEALLVNRVRGARDYYRVPIDECYRLVGVVRMYWHGLSGGTEVWDEIDKFFADLTRRSQPVERTSHA